MSKPALEYDGLQVYKISDGNAWIRTIASTCIEALVMALKEDSGEYWGDGHENEATFTVVMDPEGNDIPIDGCDGEITQTAAQWAHDNGEGVLCVSEY